MTPTLQVVLALVGAYLVGALPFGWLAGRVRGLDIRSAGSGNIGATNVARVLGWRWGLGVFLLDVGKGFGPTLVAGRVLLELAGRNSWSDPTTYLCWLSVGAATVIGHNFPIYLGLRGGKGVATTLGVALGVYPDLTVPAGLALGVWVAVVALTRYVSAGSICAAVAFPAAFVLVSWGRGRALLAEGWPLLAFTALLAGLVLVRHRSNLGRLWAGTESKIGQEKEGASSTSGG
ncbi:MAG: glycerol-3-phosphate 1-O-acyltransferase PlsY [Phycisphaerae bacterium]